MYRLPVSLIVSALLLGAPLPALAQDEAAPATEAPEPAAEAPAASSEAPTSESTETPDTGAETAEDTDQAQQDDAAPREGERYTLETHDDWSLRCLKVSEGEDPCEMHQLLTDENGVQTAEISVFPVNRGEAVAGATVITPLNTQLTQGVALSVDGGPTARYPFIFCNRIGCFSQFGLATEELSTLKRGSKGTLTVVSMGAPDRPVQLDVSLAGFTAAYDALSARQ